MEFTIKYLVNKREVKTHIEAIDYLEAIKVFRKKHKTVEIICVYGWGLFK